MTNIHSPLAHIDSVSACANTGSQPGVIMQEDQFRGHLIVRGNSADNAFASAIQSVLGVALPIKALTAEDNGKTRIGWLGPNEWLVLVEANTQADVEAQLRAALDGQHVAITDVSSAQTLVNLAGAHVHDVMMKSTVYDCSEHNLPVHKFVQTTFAKTGACLYRCDDGSIDMIIRRSFADYFFLWLADASEEYGLLVK